MQTSKQKKTNELPEDDQQWRPKYSGALINEKKTVQFGSKYYV